MPSQGPQKPVTLQQIAATVGVGRTTVSLALRNHPKISAGTRARVHAAARKLGYRPNPLVAAHMAHIRALHPPQVGQCIAFLCNRSLASIEADTKTPLRMYYHGAMARAEEVGYRLELFDLSQRGMTQRRLSGILRARGIQGVIVAPLSEGGAVTGVNLDWDGLATAMIEHTFLEPRLHKSCNDEFSTIGRLIQRLLDYGYERIGIAMASRMDEHANHFWLAGYQAYQALTDAGHRIPHCIVPEWRSDVFLAWFREHRPEAIITVNDEIVHWLRADGVRVPEQVGCATVYWRPDRPELSGYYQNHELMAAAAVDLVAGQLYRNERGLPEEEKTVLIQASWREGRTLARRTPMDHRAPLRVWVR